MAMAMTRRYWITNDQIVNLISMFGDEKAATIIGRAILIQRNELNNGDLHLERILLRLTEAQEALKGEKS